MKKERLPQEHKDIIGPAEAYEREKVPAMFRPAAEFFLSFLDIPRGAAVLDLACGTGIVNRVLAEKLNGDGTFVGVDIDADMIRVARASSPEAVSFTYHVGSLEEMFFLNEAAFDWALCQQGFQFVQNKNLALAEVFRVLKPGGRLALYMAAKITPENQPYQWAKAEAYGKHVSMAAGEKERNSTPYFDGSEEDLHSMLGKAGFNTVNILNETKIWQRGTPAPEKFPKLEPAAAAAVAADMKAALQPYMNSDGMAVPFTFHIVECTKPG